MNDNEKKKIFMMRVIIGGIFFVVLILWAFNLKNVWQSGRQASPSASEWLDLKQELTQTLDEVQVKLNQIKADQAIADKKAGDKLASGILADAARKTASSSLADMATSSPNVIASSSPVVSGGCPEYIDCMPTVGAPKPCVVPPGCEGITLIAY